MAHGDAREGEWRGNWRMQCVASTLHITSEHGVSSITTADAHTSAASSRMNWRPWRFKWTRPFRRKTKSGFCACAITFQLASTDWLTAQLRWMIQWPDICLPVRIYGFFSISYYCTYALFNSAVRLVGWCENKELVVLGSVKNFILGSHRLDLNAGHSD